MTDHLADLSETGVSIWLDDLDRTRLTSGNLQDLIDNSHVVGVTTNPAIFDHSITTGADAYAAQVAELAAEGADVDTAVVALTSQDVSGACDLLRPVYDRTAGFDGRVSIEVDPRLANDTDGTIAQAKHLWALLDKPNLLVKIPATLEGLPAISKVIGAGISVNVTLIFSVERYQAVIDAYMTGLEEAAANGVDLSTIHSVASFFVSRVDSNVDAALEKIGTDDALALRGEAGIANARLAWGAYLESLATPRWEALAAQGANPQRPLWASTGVKSAAYADDRYVVELAGSTSIPGLSGAGSGVVNTMPEKTLNAVRDHGNVHGNTLTDGDPQAVFDALTAVGVDLPAIFEELEADGVVKFVEAWKDLLANLQAALDNAK